MRKTILILFVCICFVFVSPIYSQTSKPIQLEWDDPNNADNNVLHHTLYEAKSSTGPWTAIAQISVDNAAGRQVERGLVLDTGRYWFYVTASNWAGESGPSNIITISTNRPTPVIIRIKN